MAQVSEPTGRFLLRWVLPVPVIALAVVAGLALEAGETPLAVMSLAAAAVFSAFVLQGWLDGPR